MMKQSISSSFHEFEKRNDEANRVLEVTNDINEIVSSGLKMISVLMMDLDLDTYTEIHSTCTSYFADLRKKLENNEFFTEKILNEAFNIALNCEYVLPRTYMCLLIGCSSKDTQQLIFASDMLQAITHPLRGLLLRFTAISFFPKDTDIVIPFAVRNFKEMLFLLPKFLDKYPNSENIASSWLTSNTSISMAISNNNKHLVECFFESAFNCEYQEVSSAIIGAISESIDGPEIRQYFPFFLRFFSQENSYLNCKDTIHSIIKKCEDPYIAFNFLKDTRFFDNCSKDITKLAISFMKDGKNNNGPEIIRICYKTWCTSDIILEIIEGIGVNNFFEIIDEFPTDYEIQKEILKRCDETINPNYIRKLIANALEERDKEFDQSINHMLFEHSFDQAFYEILFSPPYVFYDFHQLFCVVTRCQMYGTKQELIFDFIHHSKIDEGQLNIILFFVYEKSKNGQEIIKLIENNSNFSKSIIFSYLSKFDLSEESLHSLFNYCQSEKDFTSFCLLCLNKKNQELIEKSLIQILKFDKKCDDSYCKLKIYFKVLNLAILIQDNGILLSTELINQILDIILLFIESATSKLFPLLTINQNQRFQKLCQTLNQKDHFLIYSEKIHLILSILEKN